MIKNLFDSYLKEIILVILFFTITPITLVTSIFSLVSISDDGEKQSSTVENTALESENEYKAMIFASTDYAFPEVSAQIIAEDARAEIVRQYLEKSNSELTPHAEFLVETADKYGLDFRLLPAIAQKESGLCRVIPENSHNCWGWGIHSKGTLKFDNYEIAIDTVAKGLKEKYFDQGYITPEQIMKKYAHPDSTTWADGVITYMNQMN